MLMNSPDAVNALIEQKLLDMGDDIVGLDDEQRANRVTEYLLETDIRTVIDDLRTAHRLLCEEFNNQSGERSEKAAAILVDIAQLVIPALYDHGVIKWVREQRDSRNVALVSLPASTRAVAEIIMAGVDYRKTRFRYRTHEDDLPEGELCLLHPPESGINRVLEENFPRALTDNLLARFSTHESWMPKLTYKEQIELVADRLEYESQVLGQTPYMILNLPKDAETQNAMHAAATALKRDYPRIMFICLDDSFERQCNEMQVIDPFCRMLPLKEGVKAPSPQSALQLWLEKLALLEIEEAKAADPNQRFNIRQSIAEAKAKIRELGGSE